MDEKTKKNIYNCIVYLRSHGYEVYDRNNDKVGKWVVYKREGMEPILHGKVIEDHASYYCVRKKNHGKDFVRLDGVIGFFDSKEECYMVR